jgi:tol-pal system protein YbgF
MTSQRRNEVMNLIRRCVVRSAPVAILLPCLVLSGCPEGRIRALEEVSARQSSDIESIRGIQAENTAAIGELRAELSRLTGKMEEVQYVAKDKTEELQRSLERVSQRVPPPAGVPEELLNEDDSLLARVSGPAADQFRNALRLLRDGDFQGSRSAFESFASENPNTAFTDNAYFWLGVIYEKLNLPDRAVGAYSEAFQRFPAEDRVAPALLRLAELFLANDSKKDAVLTLQKLVDEHPNSPSGRKGKEMLAELTKKAPPAKKK